MGVNSGLYGGWLIKSTYWVFNKKSHVLGCVQSGSLLPSRAGWRLLRDQCEKTGTIQISTNKREQVIVGAELVRAQSWLNARKQFQSVFQRRKYCLCYVVIMYQQFVLMIRRVNLPYMISQLPVFFWPLTSSKLQTLWYFWCKLKLTFSFILPMMTNFGQQLK